MNSSASSATLVRDHASRAGWRAVLLSLGFVLVSCGGGGSGAAAVPALPPPPPETAQFTDVTAASGIHFAVGYSSGPEDVFDVPFFAGGVAAGDYDADGDVDLFVVRGDIGPNLLYRNEGEHVFAEVGSAAGVANTKSATENFRHSGPLFADLDGDGDLDLFVGGVQGDPCRLFRNDGDGGFTDVTAGSGLDGMGASQTISSAAGDYDLDGDLDLLLAHWGTPRSRANPGDTEHLWRNDSSGGVIRFASVSVAAGLSPSMVALPDPRAVPTDADHTFAPALVRLDGDLYPDIVMAADFNTSQVFRNNADGTFSNVTDVEVITETNGMGSALGDYDQDGDLDWFVTSIFRPGGGAVPNGNRLYRNDGGTFVDVTAEANVADGAWGWGACFIDLENDGDLDIYHLNGWPFELNGNFDGDTSRAFIADGSGRFSNQAHRLGIADGGQGRGVICADFDNDGDADLFNWNSDPVNGARVFRNDAMQHNFLRVKLLGLSPNTEAVGARILVGAGGQVHTREVFLASNFVSHNPAVQLIGLGSAAQADSVVVEWPDGARTELGIVPANQQLLVAHPLR